jgi:hypothetical protein
MTENELAENPYVDAVGCSGGTEIGSEMKMESTAMCIVPLLYVPSPSQTTENE